MFTVIIISCGGKSNVETSTTNGNTGGDNSTPLTILSTFPADSSTGAELAANILITFSANLNSSLISSATVTLNGTPVVPTVSDASVIINPTSDLSADTVYSVNISNVSDLSGNVYSQTYSFSFTTGSESSGEVINSSSGKVYYVAENGNDSNNGLTISTPFVTLAQAISVVEGGDIIEMRQGTYAGATISRAGSASHWITVRPYNNETVIIDGNMSGASRAETLYFYHDTCDPYDGAYTFITLGYCQSMYWVVEGLDIQGGSYYSVKIDTPDIKLINNKISNAQYDTVKLVKTANDVTIFNNEIYYTGSLATNVRNAQGIDIVGADRTWVANNYVHDIPSIGMYSKGNARNTVFENNLVKNILGAGIQLGQSTDTVSLIDGNYETYDGIIRNNVVIRTYEACLQTSSSYNAKIYNNSCYDAAYSAHGAIRLANESEVSQAGTNIEIKNNIVMASTESTRPVISISSNALTDNDTLDIDNNLYWTPNGSSSVTFTWGDLGLYNVDLAAWRTATWQDSDSIIGNPDYSNAGGDDLTLGTSSQAINNGLTTALVSLDYTGSSRPSSGIDIGAYEREAVAATYGDWDMPTAAGDSQLFRYPYLQTSHPTQMKIMWGTTESGNAILYARNNDNNEIISKLVNKSEQINETGVSFYQYLVQLDDLSPDTEYTYDIVHNGEAISRGVKIKTLPQLTSDTVNVIVIGDSGMDGSEPVKLRDTIASKSVGEFIYPHDFIIGVGDIAYNGGTYAEFDSNFFGQLSGKNGGDTNKYPYDGIARPENSILSTRPFFASLGNHEYANSKQTLPSGYLSSFDLPIEASIPVEDRERYYSFDSGNAHFVILDTMKFSGNALEEIDTRLAEMLTWLSTDLSATTKNWKLVFFHHAVFSNGEHGTYGDIGENRSMRQQMLTILQDNGVQLVMFGHDHMYQRSVPLKVNSEGRIIRNNDGSIDETDGITYTLTGHGGADFHGAIQPSIYNSTDWNSQVSDYGIGYDFTAHNGSEYILFDTNTPDIDHGFTHLEITPTQINLKAYYNNGTVIDEVTID